MYHANFTSEQRKNVIYKEQKFDQRIQESLRFWKKSIWEKPIYLSVWKKKIYIMFHTDDKNIFPLL